MRRTADEQAWLDAYCWVLKEQYASVVARISTGKRSAQRGNRQPHGRNSG
jgi:hypothetical protein